MSNSPSRGGGQGPPPKQAILEIMHSPKGTEAYFRLLSPNYGGLLTHYRNKQSHYCPGPDCPRGEHKDPIWKMHRRAVVRAVACLDALRFRADRIL